jgi:hypothetical protein
MRPVTQPTASRSDDPVATVPEVNALFTISDQHPTRNKTLSLAIYAPVSDNKPRMACLCKRAGSPYQYNDLTSSDD